MDSEWIEMTCSMKLTVARQWEWFLWLNRKRRRTVRVTMRAFDATPGWGDSARLGVETRRSSIAESDAYSFLSYWSYISTCMIVWYFGQHLPVWQSIPEKIGSQYLISPRWFPSYRKYTKKGNKAGKVFVPDHVCLVWLLIFLPGPTARRLVDRWSAHYCFIAHSSIFTCFIGPLEFSCGYSLLDIYVTWLFPFTCDQLLECSLGEVSCWNVFTPTPFGIGLEPLASCRPLSRFLEGSRLISFTTV